MEILLSKEVKCEMNSHSLIGTLILDFIKLGLYHTEIPKVVFLQNKSVWICLCYKINTCSLWNIYDLHNSHLRHFPPSSLGKLTPILRFSAAVYTVRVNVARWLSYFKPFSNAQEPSSSVFSSLFSFISHYLGPSSLSPKPSHDTMLFSNFMFLFCIQL